MEKLKREAEAATASAKSAEQQKAMELERAKAEAALERERLSKLEKMKAEADAENKRSHKELMEKHNKEVRTVTALGLGLALEPLNRCCVLWCCVCRLQSWLQRRSAKPKKMSD